MSQKYSALRVISTIQKVLGWIFISVGSFAGLVATTSIGAGGLLIFISSALIGLFLLAFSEFIHLMIDIEENTSRAFQGGVSTAHTIKETRDIPSGQ